MPDLNDNIQLPSGFKLDTKVDSKSSEISLPKGFTLDTDVKKKDGIELSTASAKVSSPIESQLPSQKDISETIGFAEKLKKKPSIGISKNLATENIELADKNALPIGEIPTNLPKQEALKYEKELKVKDAAINTLTDVYKQKGLKFDPNKPSSQKQIQDYINKEKNNDLGLVQGIKDKKPYLTRTTGLGETLYNTAIESFKEPIKSTKINTISNPNELADVLDEELKNAPNVPESVPTNIGGYLGQLAGGLPKLGAEEFLGGQGLVAAEMYWNGIANQRKALYQKGLAQGMDRVKAAQMAMDNATTSAIPDFVIGAILGAGAKGQVGILKKGTADAFKDAMTNVVKSTPKMFTIGAGASLAKSGAQAAAGYDLDRTEVLGDAFTSGGDLAKMDAAFKTAMAAPYVPKILYAAAKNVLSETPKPVLDALSEKYGDNGKVVDDVNKFAQTKAEVQDLVPEAKVASVAGLTEKVKNIQKDIDDLTARRAKTTDALKPQIDAWIKEYQDEIDSYNNKINKVVESKDPTGVTEEVDDITGQKIGSKKYVVDNKEVSQEEFEAMQGKPIGTKEIIQPTELEAKKANIEERRQEELRTSLDLLPLVSKEERSLELQKRYDERESKEKEINAKYDAEIAALKEVKPTEVKVTEEIKPVETKVAKPIEGIDTIKLTDLPDRAFSVGMTKEKFEDLKSKIQKEGFTQPIIIDKETNNVLDGQNRLLVAQDLDIKDVPVVYMNNPTKTELKEKIKELEKQYIPIKEVKAIGLKEEPIIEEPLKEEPLKEEPLKEEPIESEEERKGISKEAIYNRYGFAKKFKTVHDKDLVIDVMDKLETSANKKGISTEQEAENIVEKIRNKKIRGTASQFEILASAYHLENLDKQIEKLNDLGEDPTPLLEKRQKALEVLRELGKNSGSNLRLFSNAYKVAEDGKLQIFRARLKNSLGVDIIPTTKSELAQSNLSAEDKAKVAPYVQEIENVKNELNKIKKESEAKIQKENTKEIKNYVDKEITKTETSAKLTIEEAKKAAKKLRNIADNVENFLKAKGAEGAETAGIDIQKKIAEAIRYVADKIEKGEVPDLIVRAINKFASEDLSEKELRTHITDALTEAGIDKKLIEGETTKDKAINKIIKIAKEEKSNIITKSMSDKGLINDVVNHYIHLNTPYDEVIKEATSELKKHLPDVEETDVENAILKKGEFKQQTKQELKSEIKQKQEDVKRLANTNLKVKALQVISNIKEVENNATLSTEQKKIEIEKRKSDYEKSLDKKISDNEQEIKNQIEKDKQSKLEYKKLETERNRQLKVVTELTKKLNDLQAGIKEPKVKVEPKKDIPEIEALKVKIKEADSELRKTESAQKKAKTEAENLKNKIKDIEDEIKHVQDERTVYNKEIKNPNEVNQKLKEFKDILQQEYAKIGIRKESGSKTEIKIAQDSQNAIDEIKNSDLPDDVKKEHIKDIENQRDEQLRNTKQGVLVNLKDAIDLHLEDLKSKLDEAEKNDDKETFKKTNEVLKDLQRLSDALKPNAENLKDQIDKADQDLNAILKYNKGNEFESDLKKIQDEYRASWQKTSDELQAAELLRKSQRSQAEAERKLAGGQYTEIPTTQYDVSRNKILAEQQAAEEKSWSKLNSMAMEARKQQKEKSVIAKILEARKQILVASFTAIEKVLGSAITKPIIDPIIKQSFGRLSSLITKIRPTELRNIGETYRQLKNEESARQFMSKVNDDYIDAIVKYQKDKGTPNEKEALIKLKEAEIDNNAALAYLFINANSAIDIMQIMKNGATEFDSKMGKYKQSFPEQRTKIENIRFWLEGVNRSHAAMKSISHRQALLDHYIENLQYFQDKKGYITDESRHQAWDAATLSSEEGRFGENTYLSDLISKGKNSKSEALKNLTNFSLPVAKIGINITKQGLDMAFPGELGYKVYDLAGKGTKMNEAQGKEYSNAFSKWKDGIKTAFESLPLKEKKQINTLLFRGMFGVAQYALIGYLLSNKSIKYGGSYDENDPFRKKAPRGSDGKPLKAGEWEINGKRQPTIINMIINHSPYALPASLAAVSYNQMTSRKESERHYYKIFGKVVNEVYERLPIAGALDIGKALMGADEYKFNRLVANEVPSMKNVAEFTDKDAQGNPIKRKTKTIGEMIKANYPVLRQTLPRKY